MDTTAIDRTWIALEFLKSVQLERSLAAAARRRAESPPVPNLGVLYREIAAQDEPTSSCWRRSRRAMVTPRSRRRRPGSARRSGHEGSGRRARGRPDRPPPAGLAAKAEHFWQSAWSHALQSIDDVESARDLDTISTEDRAHLDALLEGLKRMLAKRSIPSDGQNAPEGEGG